MEKRDILGCLSLKELLHGAGNQLRYVVRYSISRRHHQESVAEHMFYTAFFTLMIAEHLPPGSVNVGAAVRRALIHDVEESGTGDIIRPIKNKVREEVEAVGDLVAGEFFDKITSDKGVSSRLYVGWKQAKDETPEGCVVAFADFLSVLSYLHQEIQSGNRLIMGTVTELVSYSQKFDHPKYDLLRPLVEEAQGMVRELGSS